MNSGQTDIFIALSHFHWDHIQGLPFFAPAYDSNMQINLLAKGGDKRISNLKEIFATQMQETYFPVSMEEMGRNLNFYSSTTTARYSRLHQMASR